MKEPGDFVGYTMNRSRSMHNREINYIIVYPFSKADEFLDLNGVLETFGARICHCASKKLTFSQTSSIVLETLCWILSAEPGVKNALDGGEKTLHGRHLWWSRRSANN